MNLTITSLKFPWLPAVDWLLKQRVLLLIMLQFEQFIVKENKNYKQICTYPTNVLVWSAFELFDLSVTRKLIQ